MLFIWYLFANINAIYKEIAGYGIWYTATPDTGILLFDFAEYSTGRLSGKINVTS